MTLIWTLMLLDVVISTEWVCFWNVSLSSENHLGGWVGRGLRLLPQQSILTMEIGDVLLVVVVDAVSDYG